MAKKEKPQEQPEEQADVLLARVSEIIRNLAWATGYNVIAIPLAAGVAYGLGIVLDPAAGVALMALSTIIVAINARFLRVEKRVPPSHIKINSQKEVTT